MNNSKIAKRLKGRFKDVEKKLVYINKGAYDLINDKVPFITAVIKTANEIHQEEIADLKTHLQTLKKKTA